MYTAFFGLREKPFDLLPNPDFLFPSRAHKRAMTYLTHGIRQRAGFILLTGEVGSGKTTLIRNIIRTQLKDCVLAKVFNTKVDSLQLLMQINADFGLETTGRDKAALLRDLNDFLIDQYGQRRQAVLIVDEAQNLTPEILEEVRMLSNLETDRDKLLQIILVGQPELRDLLTQPGLLQLRQRIQINCHIHPLTAEEVREYILFRLEKAGNRDALTLTDEAVEAIATYSRGIPRLVNIICDYILIDAYSAQTRQIEGSVVHELAADLSFEAQYWESQPAKAKEGEQTVAITAASTEDVARTMAAQAKILEAIGALNKRIVSLESMPVWEHGPLLDLRERVDKLEGNTDARIKELRMSVQLLRSDMVRPQTPPLAQEEDKPAKRPGTMRSIWNFLWGN
ncbi:MAG: AAA family ATPase [Desulfovibrionales bacterium]|nr:AAA family ATPase [Desulfovibrionales bacterium]